MFLIAVVYAVSFSPALNSYVMSTEIPTAGRIFWNGTHAAAVALSNWDRDTDFDERFLQGHSTTAGTNGGATTHTHTQSQTHIGIQHRHSFWGASKTLTGDEVVTRNTGGIAVAYTHATHGHNSKYTLYATITYATDSTPANANTANSGDPPNRPVIVLKPAVAATDLRIPDGGVVLTSSRSAPLSFTAVAGLNERFIKGAVANADTDLTQDDGAATHAHNLADHSHTPDAHLHDYQQCDVGATRTFDSSGATDILGSAHHGIKTQTDATDDVSTYADWVTVVADNIPSYVALLPIENTLGSEVDVPAKAIIPFMDAVGAIPADWYLCDGTNGTLDLTSSQIKCVTTASLVRGSGGSNTHTHTLPDHGHTHTVGHTHTEGATQDYPMDLYYAANTGIPSASTANPLKAHNHTWTFDSSVPTMNDKTSHSTGSSDGRGSYRTVLWIQYRPPATVHIKGGDILGQTAIL